MVDPSELYPNPVAGTTGRVVLLYPLRLGSPPEYTPHIVLVVLGHLPGSLSMRLRDASV